MRAIMLDYRIEALAVLLNKDCVLPRYYPLIPYKTMLIEGLIDKGCRTNRDCLSLTDNELVQLGIPDGNTVHLSRAFLKHYDIDIQKRREIETAALTDKEKEILEELYKLPGVRLTRALLYCQSGYTSLHKIASSCPEEIIAATSQTIRIKNLHCSVPLSKEVKTHIAVAKALTVYTL